VLHGTRSYVLQNADGQIMETYSISAGLDYPAVGPEHALLRDQGRVSYTYATDDEALAAFHLLAKLEGIIPALESAHAIAEAVKRAPNLPQDAIVIVNLSGRGDKDLSTVMNVTGVAETGPQEMTSATRRTHDTSSIGRASHPGTATDDITSGYVL
jgi:tryptophan synthase beta chain